MPQFTGPQPGYKMDRGPNRKKGPKGAMKMLRKIKREEAEERQKQNRANKIDEVMDEVIPPIQGVLDELKNS